MTYDSTTYILVDNNNCYHGALATIPMEAKLNDPDCTCSAFTEQWSMWTEVHNCGLWFIWTKQYKLAPVT